MFSIARFRYTILAQTLFSATNFLGVLIGVMYRRRTPDLYPKNSHNKIGWISTWLASLWVALSVIDVYVKYNSRNHTDNQTTYPLNTLDITQYSPLESDHRNSACQDGDCSQWEQQPLNHLDGNRHTWALWSDSTLREGDFSDDDEGDINLPTGTVHESNNDNQFLQRIAVRFAGNRSYILLRLPYLVLDRTVLFLGFVAFASGTVVYGGIGRGNHVFNVLAHYIKGAIFVWYGLLTLGRWMGMFADFGWAWNVKPSKEVVGSWSAAVPSAEFTESFVIFLYGASNVFLEHLASPGKPWSARDLEHVAISIMFFGGGLLGMFIESKKLRKLLSTSMIVKREYLVPTAIESNMWERPFSWKVPMNLMPSLVILLLGLMMSGHHQESMLSAMIHKQWGLLFSGFALSRSATYMLLYVHPPSSYLPLRPHTETVASFCLISGGIAFILSNKDTVAAMEYYGMDAMFTLAVTVGLTGLTMAWAVFVCAVKGWATEFEQLRSKTD
ncbi:hypothetical protein COCMIDRAFT_10349 [Bipolaris oryzae ATCC 44560]|uniref:Protein YTP1-like C-terminal domain-containing protein n=1 Tax=Bipolaris oryzae ATCC 44560 TaxID=930090 RepID=W6YPW3_COCMI|nr:uncharacterized protein COCMIDRAFT_10349 [Bipolaris oryzae ATCC 44560]EUC39563.1 hypothetical protein COCMIDRAFT_10349 [Bipolaris oryzae ATCC 44560]